MKEITFDNIDRNESFTIDIDEISTMFDLKASMINNPVITLTFSPILKVTDYIHIVFENDEYRKILNEYKGEDDNEPLSILGMRNGDIIKYNLEGWYTYQYVDIKMNRSYYILDKRVGNIVKRDLIYTLSILDDMNCEVSDFNYYFENYLKYYYHLYEDDTICVTAFESDLNLSFGHKREPPLEGMLDIKRDKLKLGEWSTTPLVNEALSHIYSQMLNVKYSLRINVKDRDIVKNVFYFLKWKAVINLSLL